MGRERKHLNTEKVELLRKLAGAVEKTVAPKEVTDVSKLSPEDVTRLIQQNQGYQTELELRNKELLATEGKLRQSLDNYADLFDFSPVAYFVLNEYNLITAVNYAGLDLLQAEKDAIIRKRFTKFVSPKEITPFYAWLRKSQKRVTRHGFELSMVRADGTRFYAELWGTPLPDSKGKITGFNLAVTDITRRKEAEIIIKKAKEELDLKVEECAVELVEEKEKYRSVLETANEGVLIIDVKGIITFVNSHLEEMIGYSKEELIGKQALSIIAEDYKSFALRTSKKVRKGEKGNWEYKFRCKDGHYIWTIGSVTPLYDERERYSGILAMHTDITERKQAEEELRNLSRRLVKLQEEERSELSREIHDGMGQYLALLNLLLDKAKRSANQDSITDIVEAQKVVKEIVSRVRHLSISLHPDMLDTIGLKSTLLWYFRDIQDRTGLQVDFKCKDIDKNFPLEINVAAFRIIQEALTNTIRHSGVNRVAIQARTYNGLLSLEIEDKGKGFNPVEVPPASSGLRGMRERTRALDGNFTVVSAPGAGTCIKVELPYQRAASNPEPKSL